MASTGMAMPLDDLIAADGDEGKAYIDDFLSGFMEDSYVDGKIYSIPFQRSTEILFYNKDAFKEVGLDPEKAPATWDELVEDAKLLTNEKPLRCWYRIKLRFCTVDLHRLLLTEQQEW